jgi:GT2 family glycosyltransferase
MNDRSAGYESIRLGSEPGGSRPVLEDISVVIPTLGRPVLETCLGYLLRGSAWPARLIVVDQGSNPEVRTWLELLEGHGFRTTYVPSTERGRSAGINRGFERVETRYVAVTDDDCFVEPNWLTAMRDRMASEPMSIVSGRVEPVGHEANVAISTSRTPETYHRPRLRFDVMSGGNMGTSAEVLARVGPFDEDPRVRLAEDGEWSYRALRSGVSLTYDPEICLRHLGWRNSEERGAQYRAYARSHGGFYGKYIRRGDWFIALRATVHLVRSTRRWIVGAITGNRENALRGRAYTLNLVPGILAGLRRSRPQ